MNDTLRPAHAITLEDKYTLIRGSAFMTGTQALVRLPMMQQSADAAAGHRTAGFITGYRGSPVGSYDQALWKAREALAAHDVRFQPGVNEDLAATALWGTQQTGLFAGARYDGVFGIWYGKGPGVDRCGDVFKHANMAGTAPLGGVIALAGDDHGARSSTTAHQSEQILAAVSMPIWYPSSVQDILDYGLHGFAMSRFTGLWVAMKCVTDIVESGAVVTLDPERVRPVLPTGVAIPPGGLHIRLPDFQFIAEEDRLLNFKLPAAKAYLRANALNRVEWTAAPARATLGLISAGKAYRDLRQALADLGIDPATAAACGLRLMKLAVTWPLVDEEIAAFADGLDEILVVEEKRPLIETQVKDILYALARRPQVTGKRDAAGAVLVPLHGETSPTMLARVLAARLLPRLDADGTKAGLARAIRDRLAYLDAKEGAVARTVPVAVRQPYFCSGCPHNTSTRVPEGSRALAGIGCHFMAQWMDRQTATFTHMGGEGMSWAGQAPFTDEKHVFINIGDGTYFHSGLLAIRAAVASGVNATYKLLYNDAVAMTGGQPVDGTLTPPQISRQLEAEGVAPIVVVTDEPDKYPAGTAWAPGVTVRHRDELDAVQRELRARPGISAIIYDQTCASEKRRRRKRDAYPDPARRVVINEAVCEGCGDCSAQSNCVSVEPLETEFGRKRQINQSSCNKDFSCVKGFCPSFVSVVGGSLRKPRPAGAGSGATDSAPPALPLPSTQDCAPARGILVTGVGGTGVITIGQILAMAAHLEGKAASVLDMSGLAQKGGPVTSHVWIAEQADDIHTTRVGTGAADLVIGCDLVVTANRDTLQRIGEARTHVVVNDSEIPTAAFVRDPDWQYPEHAMAEVVCAAMGSDAQSRAAFVPATQLATALMGDAIATNMFLLGYAAQRGWLPVGIDALSRAIALNGVAVAFNQRAFDWGRYAAVDRAAVARAATPAQVITMPQRPPSLDERIALRRDALTQYQDAGYARRYLALVAQVRAREAQLGTGTALTDAVARHYYKLMAYKDEYEVARLHSDPAFRARIAAMFEGEVRLHYHLAPPLLARRNAAGELLKREYGPWVRHAFGLLARLRFLRGTVFDPFGYTAERREERALIDEYARTVQTLLDGLHADNLDLAVRIAALPDRIRGYGHVKARAVAAFRAEQAALLAQWPRAQAAPNAVASAA